MPRASKPVDAVKGHITKAQIEVRKKAEDGLKTGVGIIEQKETKKNKIAHKEFLRVRKLFSEIDKNDELYSSVINRYCQLYAECREFEKLKATYQELINEITADKKKIVDVYAKVDDTTEKISLTAYYKMKDNFSKNIIKLDSQIMTKRKMMFDIEKENLMTVQSALRSIPKETSNENNSADLLKRVLTDDS